MTTGKVFLFYVHSAWRREGGIHTPFLNPWWGNPLSESSLFTKQMFDTYAFNTECYGITDDIQKADMVLAPYPHVWFCRHDPSFFHECVQVARDSGLPLLVDGTGDVEHPITAENVQVYVLRYGGYRFLPDQGRIQIPLFADDLLERCRGGQLDIRKKGEGKPVVGFAGWANLSFKQYMRTIIKEIPVRFHGIFDSRYRACTKGVLWRMKAIKLLMHSPLVTFHSHTRSSFSGTSKTAKGDMRELREQMVDTIVQSDYALDVRGDANASARLFEILSLGRIPVIVDTERNFPFSNEIDYSSFALIVDFRDINQLPRRIAEFHKNISSERFEQMQRNARATYVNYFRVDALMQHIVEDVRARISHA